MKRLWACVIILALLIPVCLLGIYNMKSISGNVIRTITDARDAEIRGDTETSVRLSEKAVEDWRGKHSVLCLYMPHARLESVDQTISGLPKLCQFGAKEQFLADCDRGISQLSYLTESEIPSLANIF